MRKLVGCGTLLFVTLGCQTIAPPEELTQARDEIKKAERVDVDDMMPSAMELANRQLDEAESLWQESKDLRDDNALEDAQSLERQAVEMAVSARDIAATGVEVLERVASWDQDPRQFAQMKQLAGDAEEMSAQYAILIQQSAEERANRGTEPDTEGLTDGEVLNGVPLAYFATAKAQIRSADEEAIASAAKFLKENESAAVVLSGHADPRGSKESNRELARQRAEAVAAALRNRGVAEQQITMGEPVEATKENQVGPAEWQLDRKVLATFETGVAH